MSGVTLFKVTSSVSWIQPYIYTYTGPYIYLNEFSQKKIIIIIGYVYDVAACHIDRSLVDSEVTNPPTKTEGFQRMIVITDWYKLK